MRSRTRARRLGLRTRISLAFALGGLVLSSTISVATLALTRQNLLEEREETSFTVFANNGRRVRNELTAETDDEGRRAIVERLGQASGTFPLLFVEDTWTAAEPLVFDGESVPDPLRDLVAAGTPGRMRAVIGGRPAIVSAVLIQGPGPEAIYYEAAPLDDIQDTLDALAVILFGVSAVTTLLAAATGWWAARRMLKPLAEVRAAAESLAAGALDTRLDPPADADLASLSASFNEMAQALEDRIERDNRFASEVSHELRSPLMTLIASVEVLANSRGELSERGRTALDLLAADIARFNQLVEDLLEISRYDDGTAALHNESIDVVEFVQQAIARQGRDDVGFAPDPAASGTTLLADKRRLAQVVSNLIDNADKYGAGEIVVDIERRPDRVLLGVEDNGPGVAPEERRVIFDRFNRGRLSGRRGRAGGSGLGLALVAEHVDLHRGRVWVEDRPGGGPGARFVVELPVPAAEEEEEAS